MIFPKMNQVGPIRTLQESLDPPTLPAPLEWRDSPAYL